MEQKIHSLVKINLDPGTSFLVGSKHTERVSSRIEFNPMTTRFVNGDKS